MNLDKYESQAKNNPNLKKYLDLNRFSFAIQHKLAGDRASFTNYYKKIDLKNLTSKQRLLLKLPKSILKVLLKTQNVLEKKGVRLTSFK